MSASEISKRYAKALLASVKQKSLIDQADQDLMAVAKAFTSAAETTDFFFNPLISNEDKKKVVQNTLSKVIKTEEVLNLLLILAENGRIHHVAEVFSAFQVLVDQEQGLTRGEAISARELSDEAKKQLEEKISTTLKKKIILTYKEDSSLVGGVLVKVGGMTFDDTIKTHLKNMNEDLHRRAH